MRDFKDKRNNYDLIVGRRLNIIAHQLKLLNNVAINSNHYYEYEDYELMDVYQEIQRLLDENIEILKSRKTFEL